MEIKLNNGLTVDINPDTQFWCERLWRHERFEDWYNGRHYSKTFYILIMNSLTEKNHFSSPVLRILI